MVPGQNDTFATVVPQLSWHFFHYSFAVGVCLIKVIGYQENLFI